MLEMSVLSTGLVVFVARIVDVAVGTIRTIVTVQGRTAIAFVLAIFEITIWVTVVSAVIHQVGERPLLVVFYAFGYATGNVVGIMVERRLAFGVIILRVITRHAGAQLAAELRAKGQPVTVFTGEGMQGPVSELYIACRRRDLKWIQQVINDVDANAFYTIEQLRGMNKILKPVHTPLGGWRTTDKRK